MSINCTAMAGQRRERRLRARFDDQGAPASWVPDRPIRGAATGRGFRLLCIWSPVRHQSRGGTVAAIGISRTVGACRSAAAATSDRSTSMVSARAAWQPYPRARASMSMSSLGTPGESSISANALRIAYSPFRSTTKRTGSRSYAAVQRDWPSWQPTGPSLPRSPAPASWTSAPGASASPDGITCTWSASGAGS